jgi:plastocyanin
VPDRISIPVGTTVEFLIRDGLHQPYSEDAGFESEPDLGDGQSYSFTFNQPGTFTLLCRYHSEMRATVVVTP